MTITYVMCILSIIYFTLWELHHMKNLILLTCLVLLASCSSSVKKSNIINLTSDKQRLTPTITSQDFKIHSIDNIVPQEGKKGTFIIREGIHRLDITFNRIRCASYGGGLLTIPGTVCNKTTGDLMTVKFIAKKGQNYKLVPKPSKIPNTTIGLVINMKTGKIVSY